MALEARRNTQLPRNAQQVGDTKQHGACERFPGGLSPMGDGGSRHAGGVGHRVSRPQVCQILLRVRRVVGKYYRRGEGPVPT